jgi:hypothetical protein
MKVKKLRSSLVKKSFEKGGNRTPHIVQIVGVGAPAIQ